MKTLLRVDKNGTKYYEETCSCERCRGTGIVDIYIPVNGGECFECWGAGVVTHTWKEYTPEYEAKLEARRAKRQAEKIAKAKEGAEERNKEFFENNGFNQEGKTWAVLGNTYSIKEELKELGAKWHNHISAWCLPYDTDKYPTVELDVDDIYFKDYTDSYKWNNWVSFNEDGTHPAKDKIKKAQEQLNKATNTSEFIGSEKDKVELEVTLLKIHSYETNFTYYGEVHYIYKFVTSEGNIVVWKTSKWLDIDEGSTLTLKGSIKEHSEYNGEKQTVLTRCKIA